MGQQQLLLLVLGIVIVGIAVVAGIQAFSEGKNKAERDAMVSDAVRIASDLQAWVLKPTAFGGLGNETGDYTTASFADLGYSASSSIYETANAEYKIQSDCTFSGVTKPTAPTAGNAGTSVYINGKSADSGNAVCVVVSGTTPENIGTASTVGS